MTVSFSWANAPATLAPPVVSTTLDAPSTSHAQLSVELLVMEVPPDRKLETLLKFPWLVRLFSAPKELTVTVPTPSAATSPLLKSRPRGFRHL